MSPSTVLAILREIALAVRDVVVGRDPPAKRVKARKLGTASDEAKRAQESN